MGIDQVTVRHVKIAEHSIAETAIRSKHSEETLLNAPTVEGMAFDRMCDRIQPASFGSARTHFEFSMTPSSSWMEAQRSDDYSLVTFQTVTGMGLA
jgi:hypothetical protein